MGYVLNDCIKFESMYMHANLCPMKRSSIGLVTFVLLSTLPLALFSQAEKLLLTLNNRNQATVYYECYGEGKPIIILHRTSASYLEPIFGSKANLKRIYIDPPAIGNSSSDSWIANADDCFAIIKCAIDSIVPNGTFAIGGFSYFGYMARAIAELYPNRIDGLLLMCPVTYPTFSHRSLPTSTKSFTDSTFYNTLSAKEQDMLSGLVVKTQKTYNHMLKYSSAHITLDTTIWNRVKRNGYAITGMNNKTRIDAPVLLMLGLQDNVVGYSDALVLLQQYTSVSVAIVDYASHSLPMEQPEILSLNVSMWLERMEHYRLNRP